MDFSNLISKISLKDILIVILTIFLGVTYIQMDHYRNKSVNPIVVYDDSLSIYKNKLNEEYIAKNVYIQEINDLKSHNADLYKEIKSLKDNPVVVFKSKIEYVRDTLELNTSLEKTDTTFKFNWNHSQIDGPNMFNIDGTTIYSPDKIQSYINNLYIGTDLTFDLVETDQKNYFKIIAKSSNPNINFTDINGAFINPNTSTVIKNAMKPRNYGIGIYAGYGFSNTYSPDKIQSGWQLGIGVYWSPSFLQF